MGKTMQMLNVDKLQVIHGRFHIRCTDKNFQNFRTNIRGTLSQSLIYRVLTPKMKFHTFSLLFPDFITYIPYQFCMKLCEIILLAENISKYWIQDAIVF